MVLEKLSNLKFFIGVNILPRLKDVALKVNEIIDYIKNGQQYVIFITQTGTAAPVIVNTVQDSLGLTGYVTLSRLGAGSYELTSSKPIFIAGKTHPVLQSTDSHISFTAYVYSSTVIKFDTFDIVDGILDDGDITGNFLTITIYR